MSALDSARTAPSDSTADSITSELLFSFNFRHMHSSMSSVSSAGQHQHQRQLAVVRNTALSRISRACWVAHKANPMIPHRRRPAQAIAIARGKPRHFTIARPPGIWYFSDGRDASETPCPRPNATFIETHAPRPSIVQFTIRIPWRLHQTKDMLIGPYAGR